MDARLNEGTTRAGFEAATTLNRIDFGAMTKYTFHRIPSGTQQTPIPSVSLTEESHLHGAALALRHFKEAGYDITTPLAHIDVTESDGRTQTVLVEEVLDWLHEPAQMGFVDREGLGVLLLDGI